ncbi:MAG: hypothetical protein KDD69_00885 [Bdellovibrionales bacterium]|nr:hypothetical protein [Bdellovibrionales bacterium]
MKRGITIACLLLGSGCTSSLQYGSTKTVVVREVVNELERERVPGTVEDVWVEPMYDQVRVPAALDPNGVYYRPSHSTLVEIRHGKVQPVQYPDYDGQYQHPPR